MGLFSFLIGYKVAKNRARHEYGSGQLDPELLADLGFDPEFDPDDMCDNCGYESYRHSDDGFCPDYS